MPCSPDITLKDLNPRRIRLADAAKVPDFSSKDIFAPTAERTRLILSAFINFVKFSEQSMPLVTKLRGKAADLIQERENAVHERARLEAQLAQLKYALLLFLHQSCLKGHFQGKTSSRRA
jgi:Nuf2 family